MERRHCEASAEAIHLPQKHDSDDALLASIQRGLSDVAQGRTRPFDAEAIRKRAKEEIETRCQS